MSTFIDNVKKKSKMILAEGTTEQDIKEYMKEMIEMNNPPEEPRKSGRKYGPDIVYTKPYNVAPIEDKGLRVNSVTGRVEIETSSYRDVSWIIWDEIYLHGRATVDELVKRFKGYDPRLLQIVINMLLQQFYIKKYNEKKEGIYTLEVMTEKERNKKLKQQERKRLKVDSKNSESS